MSVNQANIKLDSESFEELHRTYHDRLQASILGLVRNRDCAADITAAAFEAAFANRERFRAEAAPYTWLHAIALNKMREARREKETISVEILGDAPPVQLTEPDLSTESLERVDCRARLRRTLRRIPVLHRRVLIDHFIHGRSVRQIARRERVPMGTVLSRIFTAKRLLRRAWKAVT